MTDPSQLIDKLEKAEAGSRDLDSDMVRAVPHTGPFEVTRSLDAAIALVERVLPGWRWGANGDGWAELHELGGKTPRGRFSYRYEAANAKTSALALCIALLKALHAKEQAR